MIIYDVETFPNVFTLSAIGADTDVRATWEISDRRNDMDALLAWLHYLAANKIEMVGFNNIGFDYPIIHLLLSNPPAVTHATLYDKAMSIIRGNDRFAHVIWDRDQWIPQIDLFKIHHFDNVARSTSLKSLQFNMRSPSVEDLPFPVGTVLTSEQIETLRDYNMHDVTETKEFLNRSREAIAFRRDISEQYGRNFINHNDTKVGKDYFVMRLEEARPHSCFTSNPRRPVQTYRAEIPLRDVVLPYVRFEHPEFKRIHQWFLNETIYTTKGAITDISCEVNGFSFHFGTGGIHGSVAWQHPHADDTHALIDLDVTSYYPSIAIVNRLYPEHLGDLFCDIYADVMAQRKQHAKGSPINAVLKLALNGVYGDSNNPYSPFYDSKYTMAITVNGQLLLCMLAERLMLTVPELQMVQINTDGLTIRVPRCYEWLVREACEWWQTVTALALEEVRYAHMFIRDVNSYLAVGEDGKVKRKGAYENQPPDKRNPLGWHQDLGAMVIPKVVEQVIVNGADPQAALVAHADPFDFMLRAKVPRGSRLMHGDQQVQGTTRYYVATQGAPLVKISPPMPGQTPGWFKRGQKTSLSAYTAWHEAWGNVWNPEIHTGNKSIYEDRHMQIQAGWDAAICNRASDFDWGNLNYNWYLAGINKLLGRA